MENNKANPAITTSPSDDMRKRWFAPVIEDADISAITHGTGDSGIEGIPFLKPGS